MTGKRQDEPRYDTPDLPRRHVSRERSDPSDADILRELQREVDAGRISEAEARATARRCWIER